MLLIYAGIIPQFAWWAVYAGHSLMVTAGFLLKELAHEHNISVMVIVALMLLSCLSVWPFAFLSSSSTCQMVVKTSLFGCFFILIT